MKKKKTALKKAALKKAALKKAALWIIAAVAVLTIAAAVCFLLDYEKKNDSFTFPEDSRGTVSAEYLEKDASGQIDLDAAIGQVILAENDRDGMLGECPTEGHIIFGYEQNDNKITAYTMTSFASYGFQNGYLTNVSGSVVPARIVIDTVTGEYAVRYAADGAYYTKSIKQMFPMKYWQRAFGESEEDRRSMLEQETAQAEKYLKEIGRDAEVRSWRDVPHVLFTDIGMPIEISNELEKYLKTYDFYGYIGNEEIIEDGVRYVYRTSFLSERNSLLFTKEIYGKDQAVSLTMMDMATGDIIPTANIPDGNPEKQTVCDFIDAEAAENNDGVLTVRSLADGTQYKVDTAPLSDMLKPAAAQPGMKVRIFCMGINTGSDGTLHNVVLVVPLDDMA